MIFQKNHNHFALRTYLEDEFYQLKALPFYSQHYNPFPLTGTGMENCIPEFWEREREWKTFGNGNGNEKLIPKVWEREWEAGIPGNGREQEFPLTPGILSRDSEIPVRH